jgi:DNA-binding transcriptional LysR family regulator
MREFDCLGLDGNSLRTFLAVLEEGSVTKTARRVRVSHTLEKLRVIFDDPIFVRDGRGITLSAKALAMREPIESRSRADRERFGEPEVTHP